MAVLSSLKWYKVKNFHSPVGAVSQCVQRSFGIFRTGMIKLREDCKSLSTPVNSGFSNSSISCTGAFLFLLGTLKLFPLARIFQNFYQYFVSGTHTQSWVRASHIPSSSVLSMGMAQVGLAKSRGRGAHPNHAVPHGNSILPADIPETEEGGKFVR